MVRKQEKVTKKPVNIESLHLFHFWPGHRFILVSTPCGLDCLDCWKRRKVFEGEKISSIAALLDGAKVTGVATAASGHPSNFLLDLFRQTRSEDRPTVLATLGLLTEKRLNRVLPLLDAVVLHVKGISKESYAKLTGIPNGLQLAFRCAKEAVYRDIHLEIAYTVVPGVNASSHSIHVLVNKINELDARIPLHLLRFLPSTCMKEKMPTRDRLMKNLWSTASETLPFVYRDDLYYGRAKNTYLPDGDLAIKRRGENVFPIEMEEKCKTLLNITGKMRHF